MCVPRNATAPSLVLARIELLFHRVCFLSLSKRIFSYYFVFSADINAPWKLKFSSFLRGTKRIHYSKRAKFICFPICFFKSVIKVVKKYEVFFSFLSDTLHLAKERVFPLRCAPIKPRNEPKKGEEKKEEAIFSSRFSPLSLK